MNLVKQGVQTQTVQLPPELDQQRICWHSRNFSIIRKVRKYYISKKDTPDGKVYRLSDDWMKHREDREGFCLVPLMDTLLSYKIEHNVDFTLLSLDLRLAHSLLENGQDPTYSSAKKWVKVPFVYQDMSGRDLGDPIDDYYGDLYNPPTLTLSPVGGVIVVDYQNLPEIQVMVYWLDHTEPQESQDWWVGRFELDHGEEWGCLRIEFKSTHLTKRNKEVYLGTIYPLESHVDGGRLLFCCLATEPTTKTLYLRSQQLFAPEIDYYCMDEITLLFMEVTQSP